MIPLFLKVTWKKQSKLAMFLSPLVDLAAVIVVWTVTAYKIYGKVTITTTREQLPCMYGSLTALVLPGIVTVLITLIKPDNFDWSEFSEVDIVVYDKSDSSILDEKSTAGDEYDQSLKRGDNVENV